MRTTKLALALFLILLFVLLSACTGAASTSSSTPPTSSSTTPVSSTSPTAFSRYDLAYKILAAYPDYFWCDPDFYPVARDEMPNALVQFASIQADTAEFSAILKQTGLPRQETYSDEQKLIVYREHKKLNRALTLTSEADHYAFVIRISRDQGKSIEGTISAAGNIKVLKETDSVNTCPICLTRGTLIATPSGGIPVEALSPGLLVWSVDSSGLKIKVPILKTSQTAVPLTHQVVRVTLADGRSITASPGHPSAQFQPLGEYKIGDILDGSPVSGVDLEAYDGQTTFDLLPGGTTGLYYANGILLGSTLAPN